MALQLQKLGSSDIFISRVGVGTAPIGSTPEWKINWGHQDKQAAIRAIQVAIDLGVNWIDTAPFYGWGRAEKIVGEAIRGRRDRVHVFTKCGTQNDGRGGWYETLKPAEIRREIEASLRNLQTDYVDLYQFHDPDPSTPIEESWATLQALVQEGKVRYGGLSNHPVELIDRAMAVAPVIALQHQYSLLAREVESEILPYAQKHDVGVLAWGTLAHGFLVDSFDLGGLDQGDFRRRHPYASEETYGKLLRLRVDLGAIARDHNKTLRELAVAWTLMQPAVTGDIIGIRNESEAAAISAAIGWRLTAYEMSLIDEILTDLEI
jgi:aryl-alcohol dehydrogenase-like predicted oxidoreductase